MLNSVCWSENSVIPNGGLVKLKLQHNITMSFSPICANGQYNMVKRVICPGEMQKYQKLLVLWWDEAIPIGGSVQMVVYALYNFGSEITVQI